MGHRGVIPLIATLRTNHRKRAVLGHNKVWIKTVSPSDRRYQLTGGYPAACPSPR